MVILKGLLCRLWPGRGEGVHIVMGERDDDSERVGKQTMTQERQRVRIVMVELGWYGDSKRVVIWTVAQKR